VELEDHVVALDSNRDRLELAMEWHPALNI